MSYHTGATFYPGGDDSYYIPEVVAPMPQRIAELPSNMQENVAQMEQQASWRNPNGNTTQAQQYNNQAHGPGSWSPTSPTGHGSPPNLYQQPQYQEHNQSADHPNFSLFPALQNRGPNVPPSDDERETSLENAREAVLRSSDFEMQLTWAQDALSYVEVAIQNEKNVSATQVPRSRTPRIEHMLREDATKVVSFLAEQRHPKAEYIRGTWLEFGKFGHRVDKREAYACYMRASERGYARAYYRIGMQFENSNDALKAIKYYQMGVDAGDAASCYRLGMMTLLGQHGQMRDYGRGLQLVTIAAQKADDNAPQGAYVLGMLQAGELAQVSIPEHTLPRNILQAKANIEKAAFLGFAKAQVRMGSAYELGDLGCKFDPALSLHYNALAARQCEPEAEMAISKWFLCGHEGLFDKNEEMAFTYAQRAAVSGLATAQFAMGYFYEVGIYVSMDLKQAREWYAKADESGNTDARKRIDAVSRSKTISRRDHESVSLQRIRQQHANAAGAPALPSVSETPNVSSQSQNPTLTMPDPAKLSLGPDPATQRPTSVAPYPTDSNLSVNQPNPNVRPTSAFGINPRLQQQSQYQNYAGGQPDSHRKSSIPTDRPYSSIDVGQSGPGYGRGNRISSGPPGAGYPPQQQQQRMPQQQRSNAMPPYSGPQNQPSPRPPQGPQSPPLGAVDIGFSAPLDTRTDRQRRPIPSQQQQQQSQRPSGPQSTSNYSSQSGTPRPQQQQQPQNPYQKPQLPRTGGGLGKPLPNNPQLQQRTESYNNIQPANLAPSKPISAPPTPRPDQQKPNTVPAATAAIKPQANNTNKPGGKGPKTFDEMGVPQAQKESDCIVM